MPPIPTLAAAFLLAAAALAPGATRAGPQSERVLVLELFSSQACAACPAADAVVADMAQGDAGLLPLDLHVTWFDRAGWKDSLSLPAASQRQRRYVAQLGTAGVYTPQVVVGGRHEAVGYDAPAVQAAVARARQDQRAAVGLELSREGGGLRLQAGAGHGRGTLWLVGYDSPAGRGGPAVNTVRMLEPVGDWTGAPVSVTVPAPRGTHAALLLQDERGGILAAAALR